VTGFYLSILIILKFIKLEYSIKQKTISK